MAANASVELDPDLSFDLLPSPSWRSEGDPSTPEMLQKTAEFISYYRRLPQATIAKVKERSHHTLACNYVLVSNVGENVGSKTIGDTEDVIRRFVEKGSSNNPNSAPRRDEQETINTLRALKELEGIQKSNGELNSPAYPLLSPSELRQVHQKLLEHDDSCEPGKYRNVLVCTNVPGPMKDPRGTIKQHSAEICLRGIAASKELPEVNGTMDEVIAALSHRLDCSKDEQVILRKVAQDIGYSGSGGKNEIIEYLLPECTSALFGSKDVGRIVTQPDTVDVVEVLSQLAKHYGISIADPPTCKDAMNIHRKLVADLPSTLYIYPIKTPEMIEDTLQELYGKQKRLFEAFSAKYSDEDLKVCQTLKEALCFLARIAAYSLFQFVCLHPFRDGNGRMCRLIASAIMSAIVPFPTGLACEQMPGKKTHRVYVDAIVELRQQEDQQPIELATLIVEGAYYCSLIMKSSLRDHLKLGEMTCAAQDSEDAWRAEVGSVYHTLDHSKRPEGHQSDAEIEMIIWKMKKAIVDKKDKVEVEFDDKFFVEIDILC